MYFIEMTLAVNHGNKLFFIVIVIVIVKSSVMQKLCPCDHDVYRWHADIWPHACMEHF